MDAVELVEWKALSGDAFAIVLSFLTPSASELNHLKELKDNLQRGYDDDREISSSDDEDVDLSYMDNYAHDLYMDRQLEREGQRRYRMDQARRRAKELRAERSRLICLAKSAVAMAGTCAAWRLSLTADDKLWENIVWTYLPRLFTAPTSRWSGDGGSGDESGCKFVPSLPFWTVIRIHSSMRSAPKESVSPSCLWGELSRTDRTNPMTEGIFSLALDDFVGMGKVDGDNVLRWKIPGLWDFVDNNRPGWWREVRKENKRHERKGKHLFSYNMSGNLLDGSDDTDSAVESCCSVTGVDTSNLFPLLEIFFTIPSMSNMTFKVHEGEPKWRRFYNGDDWNVEYEDDCFVGCLGSCSLMLLYGDEMRVIFDYDSNGHYTEESKENDNEFDERDESQNRLRDIADIFLGRSLWLKGMGNSRKRKSCGV